MLPITNTNTQFGNMERGTGDARLGNGNIGTGNIGNTGNIKKSSTCSTQLKNISAPSASPREIITQTAQAILAAYGLAPDTPEHEIVAHLFKLYAEQSGQEE